MKGCVFLINIKWKPLLINIAIPLFLVGGLSALLTMNSMQIYSRINQPPLSPPSWLFPIVWTILFILMGIASYIVFDSSQNNKMPAFFVYALQLILNFTWTMIFFNLGNYWLAFGIIVLLLILICLNIFLFAKIDKTAGILLIPYLLWVAFATYLNLAIAIIN